MQQTSGLGSGKTEETAGAITTDNSYRAGTKCLKIS